MDSPQKLRGEALVKAVKIMILLLIVQSVPAVFFSFNQMTIINGLAAGIFPGNEVIETSDAMQQFFGILTLVLYIPFFVIFLLWFRLAYLNLDLFGHKRRFVPGWAIGGFFVPFLNLVRPYGIAREILETSSFTADWGLAKKKDVGLIFWWIVLILSSVSSNIVVRLLPAADADMAAYQNFALATLIDDLVSLTFYPLFFWVIARINRLQRDKADYLYFVGGAFSQTASAEAPALGAQARTGGEGE